MAGSACVRTYVMKTGLLSASHENPAQRTAPQILEGEEVGPRCGAVDTGQEGAGLLNGVRSAWFARERCMREVHFQQRRSTLVCRSREMEEGLRKGLHRLLRLAMLNNVVTGTDYPIPNSGDGVYDVARQL